ncbi:MAG: VacJ family lipoprotein [Desulfuromusa sp.]|nr:VacJ family lipoprotein [Desulfuromusa sp.]
MTESIQVKMLLLMTVLSILLLSGCSTIPKNTADTQPPLRQFEDVVHTEQGAVEVSDPLEGFNRGVYRFNYYFDKFIFLPIVGVYTFIMPDYAEDRVSNFIDNIYEFSNFTNNLLQLKFKATGITLARFAINTTVGIAGLWDPATSMNIRRQPEDFGQTLGHYGVGNGPYLVLPVFGPSNLRDTAGLVVDSMAFTYVAKELESDWMEDNDIRLIFSALTAVDKRKRQPFRYHGTGSPFEYDLVRMLYTAQRKILVEN